MTARAYQLPRTSDYNRLPTATRSHDQHDKLFRVADKIKFAIFALLTVFALGVISVSLLTWDLGLSAHYLEELIRTWGMWGVFTSIGLMILHSFVPFPAELLALANGHE